MPVTCGGVTVNPGDLVMADDNGVLVLSVAEAAAIVDRALETDAAEPAIVARIRSGEPITSVLPTS